MPRVIWKSRARFIRRLGFLASAIALTFATLARATAEQPAVPVAMTVDASRRVGDLTSVWRFFGADEPNYATMKDGRKLLLELGTLRSGQVYFRAHNLLSSGDGTPAFKWGSTNAYTETKDGKPIYDWTIVDHIIDTYLARGIKPYLQIGFMPEAMTTAPAGMPYQHLWRPGFAYNLIATGWTYPPKDYAKWAKLVYRWTAHNVARYGRAEVEQWYFEVWNEPNSRDYWKGSPEEFYRLHDVAIDAVRRALPSARVGGPEVAGAGGSFMDGFLAHVTRGRNYATGGQGTPTDFLSFHAKGQPSFIDGHVRMGISTHLKVVQAGFAKIAGVPELAHKPIVIGESDPEGCAACPGPQNAYRNGTMYSSYTAESFARIWALAKRDNVNLEGALSWSFTFEDQPWFAGYRQLATNGIDLPVMNIFRMFAKLAPTQIQATSSAELPLDTVIADGVAKDADVGVLATRSDDAKLAILAWNYHDDDVPGPDAAVHLKLAGLGDGTRRQVTLWRVDGTNANAFAAWQAMGSPQSPDATQYAALEKAAMLLPTPPQTIAVRHGQAALDLRIPRQGVVLIAVARP